MGGEKGWLCQRPPWGNLVAVDIKTGEIAWKVPLGVTDELPEGKKNTGRLNLGGPMTTAGGLVFIGATNDRRFRAFDAKTGRELWAARLAMSAHAVPMTFQGRNGKQYVAVTASGASAVRPHRTRLYSRAQERPSSFAPPCRRPSPPRCPRSFSSYSL
jgi:quinoprotein glucose dehydrogenase